MNMRPLYQPQVMQTGAVPTNLAHVLPNRDGLASRIRPPVKQKHFFPERIHN